MIPRRLAHVLPNEMQDVLHRCRAGDSGQLDSLRAWEQAMAARIGASHAIAVGTGRRALALIVKHLGLKPGDELILPAYTYHGILEPLLVLGVRLVPADIDASSFSVTADTIQARLTPRTKAILVLHTFGVPCQMPAILELAADRQLPVIEDCAHSLGASLDERPTGSFGTAAFFSFEANKPVNTFGGGMVVTDDDALAAAIRGENDVLGHNLDLLGSKVRSVRLERRLFASGLAVPLLHALASPGLNRLARRLYESRQHVPPATIGYTPLQAELGLKKLASLDQRIAERRASATLLASLLDSRIRTQAIPEGAAASHYLFAVVCPCDARVVRRKLLRHGVDAGVRDELTDHCAELLGYQDCPVTNDLYPRLLQLPLYDGLDEPSIRRVAEAVNAVFRRLPEV